MPGPCSGRAVDTKGQYLSHLSPGRGEFSPRLSALLAGKPYRTGKTERSIRTERKP